MDPNNILFNALTDKLWQHSIPREQTAWPISLQDRLHGTDMSNLCPQQDVRKVCGSRFTHFCHSLPARGGRTLTETQQPFFEGTNTVIILDDCTASKVGKGRTGQLGSLGFSARHAGISVWLLTQQITSIAKPFHETWPPFFCFTLRPGKTMKAIFKDYAGELSPEEYKEPMTALKKKKFLSGLSLAPPFRNKYFSVNFFTACLNALSEVMKLLEVALTLRFSFFAPCQQHSRTMQKAGCSCIHRQNKRGARLPPFSQTSERPHGQ